MKVRFEAKGRPYDWRGPITVESWARDRLMYEIRTVTARGVKDAENRDLGGGTTVTEVFRGLHTRKDLTIVAYAVMIAAKSSSQKLVRLHHRRIFEW